MILATVCDYAIIYLSKFYITKLYEIVKTSKTSSWRPEYKDKEWKLQNSNEKSQPKILLCPQLMAKTGNPRRVVVGNSGLMH